MSATFVIQGRRSVGQPILWGDHHTQMSSAHGRCFLFAKRLLETESDFDHPLVLELFAQKDVAAEGILSVVPVVPTLATKPTRLLFSPQNLVLHCV